MEKHVIGQGRITKRVKRDQVTNSLKNVETEMGLLAMDSEYTALTQFNRLDELPIECISHIFAFFSFEELNVLSSISKKWQQYCWVFQEDIKLSIPRRSQLRDIHLKYLSKAIELKSLNLHGSKHLTDEALKIICRLPKLLKLNLSFCSGITDGGINSLRNLPNIRILNLSYCNQLTGKCFEHIATLKTLKELDLSGCGQLEDDGLEFLCQLPELMKLDLSFNKITKDGIDLIQGIPGIIQGFKYTTVATKDLPSSNYFMEHPNLMKQQSTYYPMQQHNSRYQDIDSEDDVAVMM